MIQIRRIPRCLRAVASLALASLALTACGGSSGTTSSGTTSSGTTSSSAAGTSSTATSSTSSQPERLRACLKKLGIEAPSSVSTISDLVAHPPKGVTRAKLIAAVQSCGGIGAGLANVKPHASATAYRQAFVSLVNCMREQGVNLPAPNTTGKGPVIDLKGIDTTSAKYRAASQKCAPILRKVLALPSLPKH
jgi:hypothetical protein